MKKLPFIRFILFQLLFLVMVIIGWFMPLITYPFRKVIRKHRTFFLWWFMNDDYKIGDIDSGDFGRFKHNFIGYYQQNAIRNPIWNFKHLFAPIQGNKIIIGKTINKPNTLSVWTWRNKEIKGTQYVYYKMCDTNYFRYSHTNKVFNIMIGYGQNRMITKFRLI